MHDLTTNYVKGRGQTESVCSCDRWSSAAPGQGDPKQLAKDHALHVRRSAEADIEEARHAGVAA